MSISDEAVEAALNALGEETYQRATWDEMRAALEAASPHMRAGARGEEGNS